MLSGHCVFDNFQSEAHVAGLLPNDLLRGEICQPVAVGVEPVEVVGAFQTLPIDIDTAINAYVR